MEQQSRIQSPARDPLQLTEVPGPLVLGSRQGIQSLRSRGRERTPPPVPSRSPGTARSPSQSDGLSSESYLRSQVMPLATEGWSFLTSVQKTGSSRWGLLWEKNLQLKHFQVPYKLRQCSVPPPALLAASGQLLQGGPFMSTQVCKGDETLPSHDLHVGGGEARHFPN